VATPPLKATSSLHADGHITISAVTVTKNLQYVADISTVSMMKLTITNYLVGHLVQAQHQGYHYPLVMVCRSSCMLTSFYYAALPPEEVRSLVSRQFTDKPTRDQSDRQLINSWTGQLALIVISGRLHYFCILAILYKVRLGLEYKYSVVFTQFLKILCRRDDRTD